MRSPDVVVLLPCFNEAATVGNVVADFRRALPDARIYVFDNASTDLTAAAAAAAGAIVKPVRMRGKGNVVRYAFAAIEADVYVIADGDGTYDASRAPELVNLLLDDMLDMVVATRDHGDDKSAYRNGHIIGNRIFNRIVRHLFGKAFIDIFSGYRVFSRPFVKSFPALAGGFETETEMSLHAIQLGLPCIEVATRYSSRAEGSGSKLRTYRDGTRIFWFILRLLKYSRPLALFTAFSALAVAASLILGVPVALEFMQTGLVPRLPSAVAAASLMVIGALSFATGLILDSVAYSQKEAKRLTYLAANRLCPPARPSWYDGAKRLAVGGE
jgi:glycosyltransferase involved in cell wall biosynthesis